MSRTRKERGSIAGSEEVQLWHTIRAHLRALEKLQSTSKSDLSTLDARRTRYVEHNSWTSTSAAAEERRDALLSAYKHFDAHCSEEQSEIDRALEKLELLMALRDDGASEIGGKRKKRKAEHEHTPSLREAHGSPPSHDDSITTPAESRKRSNTKASTSSAGAVSAAGSASGTQTNRDHIDPARARREVLAHQLPLHKGRKVVFRQPNKNKTGPGAANTGNVGAGLGSSGSSTRGNASAGGAPGSSTNGSVGAAAEEDGETWIMVTVIECINNDRNRYVVQDDEDAAMPKYNTTLKAIVPLPESLQTLPQEDYRVGTEVLALYPDTSCFYRATVLGGGPGLNGRITAKMQRRADEILRTPYKLKFEDDGALTQSVPANLVVERP